MNIEDFNSSDSSDEEYVPSDAEAVSEEECSGEEEDIVGLQKDTENCENTKSKKRKAKPTSFSRKRKGGIKLEGEEAESKADNYNKELNEKVKEEQIEKKKEEEKKKADYLWADFMKDVGSPKVKPKTTSSLGSLSRPLASHSKSSTMSSKPSTQNSSNTEQKPTGKDLNKKVTITTQYDFAGETVTVTKEVDANSKEAQKIGDTSQEKSTIGKPLPGVKKVGGLGSVLGKIGNKPKMGTLQKSKLDWDDFKNEEGIAEELQIHNRGKEGYVERQRFLERADVRQFEIEKSLRLNNSKKGFLSTN